MPFKSIPYFCRCWIGSVKRECSVAGCVLEFARVIEVFGLVVEAFVDVYGLE